MALDVVKNGKKNLLTGFVNQLVVFLCSFVSRSVVNSVLGAQYLGLGSLFSSILCVLGVAELGFSTAVIYNMYKPAAEGDIEKINALLAFYRKAYRIIGSVILLTGLTLIPFLKSLIRGVYPEDISLAWLYLIYLINSCLSYFMYSYLESILVVHQREDVKSTVNSAVKIFILVCQVSALYLTKNYYWFAFFMPVFTVVTNLWTAWRVRRIYPQYRAQGSLSLKDRAGVKRVVAGTVIQKACEVTRNSLDSICISAFLGLTLTAIYNNYYLILTGILSFVSIISASFMGGVGNHVATKSVSENYEEMKKLDFVYLWLGGWCTVCLLCLYQPFMRLWMGEELLLPFPAVCLLCLYFYLLKLGDVRSMYVAANGLWWDLRYRAIGETILNLVLNVVMGKLFGVYGIILATIISLLLCNYLWSVGVAFRLYFSIGRRKDYYLYQGKQSILVLIACVVTYAICGAIPAGPSILTLFFRAVICVIVPNALFYAAYRKSDRFDYAKSKILRKRA